MVKFGTSGIRGEFGKEITPDLAIRLGRAIAGKGVAKIAVGRDSRATGALLENALVSGILSRGCNSFLAGILPTPTLALAVKNYADLGVMITASHNPPECNGFKLLSKNGEATRALETKIERLISMPQKPADWRNIGQVARLRTPVRDHSELALSLVDASLIRRKKPKVVLDCGNGAGSVIMPELLRKAGCEVIELNCAPDGSFPRGLEPNEANLRDACKLVRSSKADLGIAHDGDADRAIIIDENGGLLGLDAQLALMCKEELGKNKGTVVSTIEASLCVKEAVLSSGGKFAITPVGSPGVAREMRKHGAVFGGEPCGEYIFPAGVPMPDGILTGLKFVELVCRKGSLAKLRSSIRTYPMKRAKFPCKNKDATMRRIAPLVRSSFKGKFFTGDGIRADFAGGWLLVRASGTEPIIRITAEAKNETLLRSVYSKAEAIVKKHLK